MYERDYMSKVPYLSIVGSLMYVTFCIRLDLTRAVTVVTWFMSDPRKINWETVKWIMQYLKGTTNICLVYGANIQNNDLVGYADLNHGGDMVKRR